MVVINTYASYQLFTYTNTNFTLETKGINFVSRLLLQILYSHCLHILFDFNNGLSGIIFKEEAGL